MIARDPARADYDWREFAALVRQRLAADGRGYRALAIEIGVTFTDLSRAASGQMISVHKVIALCDWMQVSVRSFYLKPSSALTPEGLRAGRPSDDGQSPLQPAAEDGQRALQQNQTVAAGPT